MASSAEQPSAHTIQNWRNSACSSREKRVLRDLLFFVPHRSDTALLLCHDRTCTMGIDWPAISRPYCPRANPRRFGVWLAQHARHRHVEHRVVSEERKRHHRAGADHHPEPRHRPLGHPRNRRHNCVQRHDRCNRWIRIRTHGWLVRGLGVRLQCRCH